MGSDVDKLRNTLAYEVEERANRGEALISCRQGTAALLLQVGQKGPIEYGLVADEVAEVYPDLLARNQDGQIETVQYYKLSSMLLNEVQKLAKAHAADQAEIAKLQAQVGEQRRQAQAQQGAMTQLLAQVKVIQATLARKPAGRARVHRQVATAAAVARRGGRE